MMYEDVAKDIQQVIEEQIELEMVELRGNGEPQFQVTMIDGEEMEVEDIVLINFQSPVSYMSVSRSYLPIDTSD